MYRNFAKTAYAAAALAALGLFAAGCSSPMVNGQVDVAQGTKKFPISVEPQMASIGVRIDPGLRRLDPAESVRVQNFADQWKEKGQGVITVSAPQGSPNQRAGEAAMHQTVTLLTKAGVPSHMISRTAYPASEMPGEPPVTLSFLSLTAVSADCASLGWPDNLGFSPTNVPWENFGCATQNNFAAMVSNPRDLVEPRAMGDADAMRRLKVIETYRKGEATQTNRKADESGSVSTAAKGEE
jgi:pilus assembly protein CpaD